MDGARPSLIDSSVLCSQVRLLVGVYIVYLMDWLTVIRREQILVLRLEDHASNRKYTMHRVFDFLNLGEWATHPDTWPRVDSFPPINTNHITAGDYTAVMWNARHRLWILSVWGMDAHFWKQMAIKQFDYQPLPYQKGMTATWLRFSRPLRIPAYENVLLLLVNSFTHWERFKNLFQPNMPTIRVKVLSGDKGICGNIWVKITNSERNIKYLHK